MNEECLCRNLKRIQCKCSQFSSSIFYKPSPHDQTIVMKKYLKQLTQFITKIQARLVKQKDPIFYHDNAGLHIIQHI